MVCVCLLPKCSQLPPPHPPAETIEIGVVRTTCQQTSFAENATKNSNYVNNTLAAYRKHWTRLKTHPLNFLIILHGI